MSRLTYVDLLPSNESQAAEFDLIQFEKPKSWRLAMKSDDNVEAIFRVQGILCGYDLPPVNPK